jgi:hypothetical protein
MPLLRTTRLRAEPAVPFARRIVRPRKCDATRIAEMNTVQMRSVGGPLSPRKSSNYRESMKVVAPRAAKQTDVNHAAVANTIVERAP